MKMLHVGQNGKSSLGQNGQSCFWHLVRLWCCICSHNNVNRHSFKRFYLVDWNVYFYLNHTFLQKIEGLSWTAKHKIRKEYSSRNVRKSFDLYLNAIVVSHIAPVFWRFTFCLLMSILPQDYAHFAPRVKIASRETSSLILHLFSYMHVISGYRSL